MRVFGQSIQRAFAVAATAVIVAACGPVAGQAGSQKSSATARASSELSDTTPRSVDTVVGPSPGQPADSSSRKFARFSDALEAIKQFVADAHIKAGVFDPSSIDPAFVYYLNALGLLEAVAPDLRIAQVARAFSDDVAQSNYNRIIANGSATKQTASLIGSSLGICLYTNISYQIALDCWDGGTALYITRPPSTPASTAADLVKIANQLFSTRIVVGNPTDPYAGIGP